MRTPLPARHFVHVARIDTARGFREIRFMSASDHWPTPGLAVYKGALLGLAVGDALGTTVEFQPRGTFPPVRDMAGGGPFSLPPGAWTDDTSMALCLAESLTTLAEFDAADQMRRYCRWFRRGYLSSTGKCFDIGSTVRAALTKFESTGDPMSGATDPRSAGNGSLMRLAPVPLRYAKAPREAVARAAESSRTTHGTREAVDACRYFAALIIGALHGASKDDLLSPNFEPVPSLWDVEPLAPEIQQVAQGSYRAKSRDKIKGSGYVVESLEAALWAFQTSRSFEEGILLAVNLGDDADTTAAIYGQLAGAFYGVGEIPERWLSRVVERDLIEDLAARLHTAAGGAAD
jgi:ADP-ribosyl-[dinitrogen reductase] hydrolase